MRTFIITEDDGSQRLVCSPLFHPCDDPPPTVIIPAVLDHSKKDSPVLIPAVIEDPVPLYAGPRENVVEVFDNAAGAKLMQDFHGITKLKAEKPGLFKKPKKV